MMRALVPLQLLALFVAFASPAAAGLNGTKVAGSIIAPGNSFNNGYLLVLGPYNDAPVIGPGIEFSAGLPEPNPLLNVTADFDDTSLTVHISGTGSSLTHLSLAFQSLTPGAFGSITQVYNSFPLGISSAVAANVITFDFNPINSVFGNFDFVAIYNIGPPTTSNLTFYGDRASWNSAVTNSSVISFEGLAPQGGDTFVLTPPGLTLSGVTFNIDHSSQASGKLFIEGPDTYDVGNSILTSQQAPTNNLVITLPPGGSQAIAMDFGAVTGLNLFTFSLSTGETFKRFVLTPGSSTRDFVGFTSKLPITSLRITVVNDYVDIDNFSFAPPPNPTPPTTACLAAIEGAVTLSMDREIDIFNTVLQMPAMRANFKPNSGLTLSEAAAQCGFTNFDWQQTITNFPSPSSIFQVGNPTPLTAPPAFFDPPANGYTYCVPSYGSPCDQYPFYFKSNGTDIQSLSAHETTNTLSFIDRPSFPGLPSGQFMGFTTQLVGICNATPSALCNSSGRPSVPLFMWAWADTFNGTSGGISTTYNLLPLDPGSGTGNVYIIGLNGVVLPREVLASQVATTASGLAYSRISQTFNGSVTLTNISSSAINGPLQIVFFGMPFGVTLASATGNLSGTPYLTVPNVASLAPGQSVTVSVQFKNPSNAVINSTPVIYSGSLN